MEIVNNSLVSCICISVGEAAILETSISRFLAQTYQNKELVVVYNNQIKDKRKIIEFFKNSGVFGYELDGSMDQMFEYAIKRTNGNFICIWKATDWHHIARIEYQYQALFIKKTSCCLINYVVLFDTNENKSYISEKKLWLETLFCTKALLKEEKYSDIHIVFNAEFDKSKKIYLINDVPNLYIHCILNTIPKKERSEIKRHSYELNAVDSKVISTLLESPVSKDVHSLQLDELLGNPLFDQRIQNNNNNNKNKIPKIIHVTYKNKIIPKKYFKTFESIKKFHPDWKIIVYDDREAKSLIKQNFPELLDVYMAYPLNIQRVDLFRVLVVYLRGGFYLDLDMHCFKSLNELRYLNLVLAEEIIYNNDKNKNINFSGDRQIGNYIFGSMPKHPFWIELIKEMVDRCDTNIKNESDVLESTGPGVLSDVFFRKGNKYDNIKVIKNKFKRCHSGCPAVCCHFGDFAAHLHFNSWTWNNKNTSKPVEGFVSTITEKDKIKLSYLLNARLINDAT